jgi:hypothetical protein
MVDYERIRGLAEKVARAQNYARNLGAMNTPTDLKARIAGDAQYRLAQDALAAAEKEYWDAMGHLSADELNELVHLHNSQTP